MARVSVWRMPLEGVAMVIDCCSGSCESADGVDGDCESVLASLKTSPRSVSRSNFMAASTLSGVDSAMTPMVR